jgi:hypothetical protein
VADSASKSAESLSVKLKNWVMSSGFSGLFAWR